MRRYAKNNVRSTALERLAKKTAALSAPMIFEFAVELARDQLCNFVLESFTALI